MPAGPLDLDRSVAYFPGVMPAGGNGTLILNLLDEKGRPASPVTDTEMALVRVRIRHAQDTASPYLTKMHDYKATWVGGWAM